MKKLLIILALGIGFSLSTTHGTAAVQTPEKTKMEQAKADAFLLYVNGMADVKPVYAQSRLLLALQDDDGDGTDHGPTFPPDPWDYDCGNCPIWICLLWPFSCP